MAQKQATLGTKLVENFQLLLEMQPNEELSKLINEHMLSLLDKRTFQCVMSFILNILNPEWSNMKPLLFLRKQDERLFYNTLSDNLKLLRKEFPGVGLPLLTPSRMACFHGERSRETLLKISKAVMLHLMKNENSQNKTGDDVMDYEALSNECDNLSKEVQQWREEEEKAFSLQKEVLRLVVSSGYWDKDVKKKMLDTKNSSIISEVQKRGDDSLKQLRTLKMELQPYFNHIRHMNEQGECECPPKFHVSEENVHNICELLWISNKNLINVDILELKLLSSVRKLRLDYFKSIKPTVEVDYNPPTALINKLEKLVADGDKTPETPAFVLKESPLAVNINHPAGDSPIRFTPVGAQNWMKIKKSPVKVDLKTVKDLMVPATIGVSPIHPLTSRMIAKTKFEKPKPNETIMSIVQRMRSKATPCKLGKQNLDFSDTKSLAFSSTSSDLFAKGTTSFGRFTPASKQAEFPVLSQTTGRRQSMGFVKPTICFARRQLKTETPLPKRQTFNCISEEKKSTSNKGDQDKILDMIVQKMVADRDYDNEGSFSSNNTDFLDSPLPTLECSSLGVNELPADLSSRDYELTPSSIVEQVAPDLMESVKSEIKKDNEELAEIINSIIGEDSPMHLNDEEPDIFLDQEMPKTLTAQPQEKPEPSMKPKKRDSLSLLIERFNAVKRAHTKN